MASSPAASSSRPPPAPLLVLRGLRVERRPLAPLTLDELVLAAGEVAALVGPSGCGKTTMLLGLTGLAPELCVEGTRQVLGRDWPAANTSAWREVLAGPVTILLQDAVAALDPLQRVGVQLQTIARKPLDDCLAALDSLGLTEPPRIAAAWPHQLSGGQAQKVLLAVALLRAPQVLIADEPTASLDGASIDGFVAGLDILRRRHRCAALVATHDMSLVRAIGAEVWRFEAGAFRAGAGAAAIWTEVDPVATGSVVMRAEGIEHSFSSTRVLKGVDLSLHRGEVVAVCGPSGCGKTTLARILAGHLAADRGTVTAARGTQLLFQDAFATLTPHRSIRSLLAETQVSGFDAEREAQALDLPIAKLDCRAEALSAGERRRAALLRALSVDPPVLVLDEPTASLDHRSAVSVMNMIMQVQRRRGLTCLLITHDRSMAEALAHRVLQFHEGRLT